MDNTNELRELSTVLDRIYQPCKDIVEDPVLMTTEEIFEAISGIYPIENLGTEDLYQLLNESGYKITHKPGGSLAWMLLEKADQTD